MAIDGDTLVVNLFLASLIIAQFEVALVAAFHTLWLSTGNAHYKGAIKGSVVAAFYFFVVSLLCLGIVTFNGGVTQTWIPQTLFVLIVIGSAIIGYTLLTAGGWQLVNMLSHSNSPETKEMNDGHREEPKKKTRKK